MNFKFLPFEKRDIDQAYQLYKLELYTFIENVFGWDEIYQKNRFETEYILEWFKWIELNTKKIGYICYFIKEDEMHISLLIISKDFQNKGYGKKLMLSFEKLRHHQNLKITLSSFKKNEEAIRFYKSIGFINTNEDEHFIDLVKY